MRLVAPILLAATLFLTACGGDDDDDAATLEPAETVVAQRTATTAAGEPAPLAIGETATLNNGLKATVKAVNTSPKVMEAGRERQPSTGEKFALVTVRLEATTVDTFADVSVACASGKPGARYFYTEGIDPASLPGKSFKEGDLLMGIPDGCTDGRIVIKGGGVFTEKDPQKTASWRLP